MDGQRFDHVTRLIGSGASRRSVLKGLTGALLGAAGLASARSQAGATVTCTPQGVSCGGEALPCCPGFICLSATETCGLCIEDGSEITCASGEECCSGLCGKGVCFSEEPVCLEFDETCGLNPAQGELSCCEGLTCIDNVCVPVCAEVGESCGTLQGRTDVVCCEGLACNDEGVCEEIEVPECETDDDCVIEAAGDVDAAICCAGACRQIECCIDDEDPNARCAEGSSCFEGICVFACKGDSDCETGTCCCSDGTCSSDCCEGAPPPETDDVTTLPTTGIGDSDGGLNGLLGAGIVAGAAVYLAGKKLRASEDEA
jgi:hypothetical protein